MSLDRSQSRAPTKVFAAEVYSSANTDLGRYLLSHIDGSGEAIVSATVSPMDYTNADTFGRDYLCAELMSKYPMWDLGIDRAGVALAKFRSAEVSCTHANARLVDFGANSKITVSTARFIQKARCKIRSLLGEFSLREALRNSRFGPGATFLKKRRHRDLYYKIRDPSPSCSYGLLPLMYYIRSEYPLWDFEPVVVPGGRVTTVPKSAKTDRTICIEPDLNILIQLGIGGCLRSRLRRVGLLFPDSQQRNAEGAREGSITGRLATIDLSSASDTISKELVRILLPPDWLQALEQSRSPVALLDGTSIPLEKFSAMGNGYTFELETLIFWALSSAVVCSNPEWDQRVLVYGDDIIVDGRAVPLLSQVFTEVGFTMNPKKTFATGPFRESCGKHYFSGVDITPFYVREELKGVNRWYWAANTVRRYSRLAYGLDSRWKPAYDYAVSQIPRVFRTNIPDGVGDVGLIVDLDEAQPSPAGAFRRTKGWEGWRYKAFIPYPTYVHVDGDALIAKSLFQLERTMHGVETSHRVPSGRTKSRWAWQVSKQWPNYGPWL